MVRVKGMYEIMAVATRLDEITAEIAASGMYPRLLLHSCCAPCASYVLEYLSQFFLITAFFYNPNITPREEYDKRAAEFYKLTSQGGYDNHVDIIICEYDATVFTAVAELFPNEPEGGRRCRACFRLRLEETARVAKEGGYDYFTTTLSVSPHKNAVMLNEAGAESAGKFGVGYIHSDFKKRDGYKRSVELSKKYGLYRQEYCGCESSAQRLVQTL